MVAVPNFSLSFPPHTRSGILVFRLPWKCFACNENEVLWWLGFSSNIEPKDRCPPTTYFYKWHQHPPRSLSSENWVLLCAASGVASGSPWYPFSSSCPVRSDHGGSWPSHGSPNILPFFSSVSLGSTAQLSSSRHSSVMFYVSSFKSSTGCSSRLAVPITP